MIAEPLFYPMFAMVLLTFAVLLRVFRTRARLAKSGTIKLTYFQTYQDGSEPAESAQLARHFSNIFEAPTLFYVACVIGMHLDIRGAVLPTLAWIYFAFRLIHAYVHIGSNELRPRIFAYFGGWMTLLAMWFFLAVGS